MALSKQMEMFEDGGLKDEGGMTDEVSGNDVPSGSTREEVRDDIPAQLSEGEFVFPADVVRYIGLEKLMQLRQEAKQGLNKIVVLFLFFLFLISKIIFLYASFKLLKVSNKILFFKFLMKNFLCFP